MSVPLAAALACVAAAAMAADPAVIDLHDPRQTVVTIAGGGESADDYRLTVRMLAVHSFDAGSDREANRSLSRAAALQALSKHLGCGPRQELAVSGLRGGGDGVEGDRFVLAFTIPRDGVKIVDKPSPFAKVKIDPEFAEYLLADPLLMEVEGAKVLRLQDGRLLVLGVASAALGDGTAADRRRAETVCRNRALAHIVAEKTGVQVARVETLDRKTVVVVDPQGGERAESVADYLEKTQSLVRGTSRDFPVVGRWTSADGTLYSVAVGGFVGGPAPAGRADAPAGP